MFISDLKRLIKHYEELQMEIRVLKQELKKVKNTEEKQVKKTNRKEKTALKKGNSPSLF